MSDTPRVSVLMTIYNAAPFLRESIDSLLAQSFSDWELIAVENGSTDDSPSILAGYRDSRIRVFSFPKNIGRTPALRHAFNQARGEYIAVLDADDIAHSERFKKEVEFLDSHREVVLVGSWAQHIDKAGNVIDTWEPPIDQDELHDRLGWMNPIVHSSVMCHREDALAVGGYPEQFVIAQDFALILSLTQRGKLAMIGEYLCKLRILPGSVTHSAQYRADVVRERLCLLRQGAQLVFLSPHARRLNRYAIARQEIRYGAMLVLSGKVWEGLKMMAGAVWLNPAVLLINRFFKPSLVRET